MKSAGVYGFNIKDKYFIHLKSTGCCDMNFGSIAIAGGRQNWINFTRRISELGGGNFVKVANQGYLNINIYSVSIPKIK